MHRRRGSEFVRRVADVVVMGTAAELERSQHRLDIFSAVAQATPTWSPGPTPRSARTWASRFGPIVKCSEAESRASRDARLALGTASTTDSKKSARSKTSRRRP